MAEPFDNQADLVSAEESRSTVRRMPRVLWLVILPLALAGGALLLRTVWTNRPAPTPEQQTTVATAEKTSDADQVQFSAETLARAKIETQEVALRSLPMEIEASGRLAINEDASARVGSPTEGRVTKVLATVGDYVKAGQTLVLVHSHELVQAQADHAKAVAALTRAEKSLVYAQAELDRANRLLAAKAISEREQMRAAADVTAAKAEVAQIKVELNRSEEFLEHLGVKPGGPDDVVISAPISGQIIKRNISIGTVVNPAEDLLVIANFTTLWAIAEVPEKQAAAVRPGQPVHLSVQAFAERQFKARVIQIGAALNPETRTTQVRCLVENVRGQLRPEMFATIHLTTGMTQQILAVPRDAIQEIKGEKVVFVPTGAETFVKRAVQTGREQGDWIEIISGLQAGERIVTRGGFFVKSEFLRSTMSEE